MPEFSRSQQSEFLTLLAEHMSAHSLLIMEIGTIDLGRPRIRVPDGAKALVEWASSFGVERLEASLVPDSYPWSSISMEAKLDSTTIRVWAKVDNWPAEITRPVLWQLYQFGLGQLVIDHTSGSGSES